MRKNVKILRDEILLVLIDKIMNSPPPGGGGGALPGKQCTDA